MLVLVGSEVLPAKVDHLRVVDPDEGEDGESDEIDDGDVAPEEGTAHILDGEDGEGIPCGFPDVAEVVGDVDGDEDGGGEEGDDDEHVAAHGEELEEADCVETDGVDESFLLGRDEGLDPGEEAFGYARGRLALLGVLGLGLVDDGIIGSQGGEADNSDEGDRSHESELNQHCAGTAASWRSAGAAGGRNGGDLRDGVDFVIVEIQRAGDDVRHCVELLRRVQRAVPVEEERRRRARECRRTKKRNGASSLVRLVRGGVGAAVSWA